MPSFARVLPLFATALLCHCGVPQPPRCVQVPFSSRTPAATLTARAAEAWAVLGDPARAADWPIARTTYNASVARLFDQLRCHRGDPAARALTLGTRLATGDPHAAGPATLDALIPAANVRCSGFRTRHTTPGLGLAVVGWKATTQVGVKREPFEIPTGRASTLTALLDFNDPGLPCWRFPNRWTTERFTIGAARHPLAADWTAPNAFYWQMGDLDDFTFLNVLLPERYMEETGLYFLEPYDPSKIPVVMVHGLKSSPDAFKHMINSLAPEPWFRERYQIWMYCYPTGNPWLYSALNFRAYVTAAAAFARSQGGGGTLDQMVVLTHSMGGLITRASVTDPGTALYDAHFKVPIKDLEVSEGARNLIRQGTLYTPLREPGRVVFMAVPHRGSPLANLRVSLWMSDLIKLPKRLTVDLVDATVRSVGGAVLAVAGPPRLPTSISSLSPHSRGIVALGTLPLPENVIFHSIVGNLTGRGIEKSSDGVVPYWSSHITPVASEKVLRYHHGVTDAQAASEEIARILKLHLEAVGDAR
jgi:hypothetical protein